MKKYVFLVALCFFYSCNSDNCSKKLPFKLDYHLFENLNINGKTYCQVVNEALQNNKEAIITLSKINIGDFASYQHGAVLIEVIDKVTIDEYLKIISSLNAREKKRLYYKIWAGLEFSPNLKYKGKSIDTAFPQLRVLLNS